MLEEGASARIYIWRLANGLRNSAGDFARGFAANFATDFAADFLGVFVGNEVVCVVRFGKQKARGKALLETAEVIFRSEDGALRLKLAFADLKTQRPAFTAKNHLSSLQQRNSPSAALADFKSANASLRR